jgi:hypothetical protein
LYSQSNKTKKETTHSNKFISAYEELIDNNRKLFNIPPIDNFFCFQDKKNIGIVNRCEATRHLLYNLVTRLCIGHSKDNEKNKTVLVDAGGNNLGYLCINLTKMLVKEKIHTDKILDNIMLSRAFTLFQLANVLINEVPALIQKLNCKMQIIVLDIFDTLLSPLANKVKSKLTRNASDVKGGKAKLLNEMLQNMINFSKDHFSVLAFTNLRKIFSKSIFSHFSQILEIDCIHDNKKNKNETVIHMKTIHAKKSLALDCILEDCAAKGKYIG